MTQTARTPQQIKQLFDLLALQCRAGLVTGDEFRARRKELYRMADASLRSESVRHDEAACFFCQEEREAAERLIA